tara:strand:+ start:605 stop:1141 length:537 start_codon:yes stop_codon:yes gene_type:complete
MTEDQIYVRKELEKIYPQLVINIGKVCGKGGVDRWGDDLLPVAIEFFLNKPIKQQLDTIEKGMLERFITYIANIQLKSKTSLHFRQYRKDSLNSRIIYPEYNYNDRFNDPDDNEEAISCIEEELEAIPSEYKQAILDIVLNRGSLHQQSKQLNISKFTFTRELDMYVKQIKNKCQQCL